MTPPTKPPNTPTTSVQMGPLVTAENRIPCQRTCLRSRAPPTQRDGINSSRPSRNSVQIPDRHADTRLILPRKAEFFGVSPEYFR